MIEINLLPRAGRKAGRRSGGAGLAALVAAVGGRVRDPYLIGAVACLTLAAASIGGLHLRQTAHAESLAEQERAAVEEADRYAAILQEKRVAEAQRDSIVRQLEIIRSIDNDRYVWSHLMEEVSRALPAFTWLTGLQQTSPVVSVAARRDSAAAVGDSAAAPNEPLALAPLRFRIVGHTVDIQALTRFMKLLEASPFIQNVQLARTQTVDAAAKQVTEFQLEAEYETPPSSAIRMVPVVLTKR